jgi:hypothetical protein
VLEADCIDCTCASISSVARAVWVASAFHLLCHHSEPATGIAGAGGLDRGVQCQQVGLFGDGSDENHDLADFQRHIVQRTNGLRSLVHLRHSVVADIGGLADQIGDLVDRTGELLCGAGDHADTAARLFGVLLGIDRDRTGPASEDRPSVARFR